jgi:hypothetical protein
MPPRGAPSPQKMEKHRPASGHPECGPRRCGRPGPASRSHPGRLPPAGLRAAPTARDGAPPVQAAHAGSRTSGSPRPDERRILVPPPPKAMMNVRHVQTDTQTVLEAHQGVQQDHGIHLAGDATTTLSERRRARSAFPPDEAISPSHSVVPCCLSSLLLDLLCMCAPSHCFASVVGATPSSAWSLLDVELSEASRRRQPEFPWCRLPQIPHSPARRLISSASHGRQDFRRARDGPGGGR